MMSRTRLVILVLSFVASRKAEDLSSVYDPWLRKVASEFVLSLANGGPDRGDDKSFKRAQSGTRVPASNKMAGSSRIAPDIRVAKALGSKGYGKLRLSVISDGPQDDLGYELDYAAPFQYRWQASFDMGTANVACGAGVFAKESVATEGACLKACSSYEKCRFFSWTSEGLLCELASACDFLPDTSVGATYEKLSQNWLYSGIVDAEPGLNNYTVAGYDVTVNFPEEDGAVSGIIWADPCFSEHWVHCRFGDEWDTYRRSVDMLNALAEDASWHFFQILGDNFYDQDSRITKKFFDALSMKAKSKLLYAVAGNHDIWVCGAPDCGDAYDQAGIGMMQYYAQDPIGGFLDFSVDPDESDSWSALNNSPRNLFWYHKLGNVGMIGYTGGATWKETKPDFEVHKPTCLRTYLRLTEDVQEACQFMAKEHVEYVILLGHWNGPGDGCDVDMTVPAVYKEISALPGCSEYGDRLKAFDGHTHCNHQQGAGETEEVLFMIGGHGMSGCSQYGFAYFESQKNGLRVYYFEERNAETDNYESIKSCIEERGISKCTHLAALWVDSTVG